MNAALLPRQFFAIAVQRIGQVDGGLCGPRSPERAEQRVVIFLADGIELMIVAARAGNRQALKCFGKYVDLVVGKLDAILPGIDRLKPMLHHAQLGNPEERFVDPVRFIAPRIRQQIAGEVFAHQLIVRHVAVERANEVIAVPPGHGGIGIAFHAMRLGISHQVHPVPRPLLAEARRSQQAVHLPGVCIGRAVRFEGGQFVGRRGQAGEIEGKAPQQRAPVGRLRRREPFCFEFCQQKGIGRLQNPPAVANRGRLHGTHRLPGPVLAAAPIEIECLRVWRFRGVLRPRCAHFHPSHQGGDLAVRQLAGGRHLQGKIAADGLDQFAVVRPVWREDRSGVAAARQSGAAVQLESGEQGLGLAAVAGVTMRGEDGTYLRFEELDAGVGAESPHAQSAHAEQSHT